jgi:hypothetical protein
MLNAITARQSWIEGEALILAGEASRGVAMLKASDRSSIRWRLALPVMRLIPALAAPMLRMRARLPEPSRR